MIFVDPKLLDECNESELWLLVHVVKYLENNVSCSPSNNTLLKDTGWGIAKLQEVKRSLREKGLLEIVPGKDGSTNIYRVTTDFIGEVVEAL